MTEREHTALKNPDPLADAAEDLILTNGGPISAEETVDGVAYVMVREDAFLALGRALLQ